MNIQERCGGRGTRLKNFDDAALFDDEETIGAVSCITDEQRRRESTGHRRDEANGGK